MAARRKIYTAKNHQQRSQKRKKHRRGHKKSGRQTSRQLTLDELECNKKCKIACLPDHPRLAPLGLRKGKSIQVKARQPWGGPVLVEVDGRRAALDRRIARLIELQGDSDAEK